MFELFNPKKKYLLEQVDLQVFIINYTIEYYQNLDTFVFAREFARLNVCVLR